MRLLLATQALDLDDPVLSVYHGWVVEIARHFERVEVVCLKEGRHALPANVGVHSLGKEGGPPLFGAAAYGARFLALAWKLRRSYDAVFVHMNQEYVVVAGWLWKLMGKPVYLWRNHYAGSWMTGIAARFSTKIFYTSSHSYTARYAKAVRMPIGIDTARFAPDPSTARIPQSVLFFGRIAPSKRPELLIEALAALRQKGVAFTASFYGSALPKDRAYDQSLHARVAQAGLADRVAFHAGVPNERAPEVFRSHDLFVNCSPSGMLDKTIFEAAACGAYPIVSNDDLRGTIPDAFLFKEGSAEDLTLKLEAALGKSASVRDADVRSLGPVVAREGLDSLGKALAATVRV